MYASPFFPAEDGTDNKGLNYYVDLESAATPEKLSSVISQLKQFIPSAAICDAPLVPWFPTEVNELDKIGQKVLRVGDGIEEVDHPSFKDPEYLARR